MSKFKVRITRVETYSREVAVEAETIRDALAKAEENEQNNEYAELFDCPDDVQISYSYAGGNGYRLKELPCIDIDSWVRGISEMSEIDSVRKEAYCMAGHGEYDDNLICPAEMEMEYTILADKYDFRFDSKGRIVAFDLTKCKGE